MSVDASHVMIRGVKGVAEKAEKVMGYKADIPS